MTAAKNTPTLKNFVQTLTIIHIVLIGGTLAFSTFLYLSSKNQGVTVPQQESILLYVLPTLAAIAIFLGNYIFKQKIEKARNLPSIQKKCSAYLPASIIRYALLEGAALLNIAGYTLEGYPIYITITGTLILYMLWLRPTREKVSKDLMLKNP
ncbi:hypothetical protein [Croceivirga sp. JEA036]|uniref:hypothetical protein n=1 Tax=Croceivirga sp. JEA036 TaxID=2721162 RepID=UPI00143C8FF1|nr:hypothetical protein [Croceivirga sp. JEA036]NJB36090.1 hypothetical protein [Croceivirga sp. JEA036]